MTQKPVGFNNEILPACVAFSSDNFEGSDCYFAGWGFRYSSNLFFYNFLNAFQLWIEF